MSIPNKLAPWFGIFISNDDDIKCERQSTGYTGLVEGEKNILPHFQRNICDFHTHRHIFSHICRRLWHASVVASLELSSFLSFASHEAINSIVQFANHVKTKNNHFVNGFENGNRLIKH